MALHRIWPATNGPNTDTGDATDISRGVIFRLSATGWLTAIRFYRGTTNVGNWSTSNAPQGQVYLHSTGLPVSGTLVTFALTGTGWLEAALPTPVQLTANTTYKAAVITGNYTATGGYFASGAGVGGIVSGIITAPDAGGNPSGIGSIQQGSFKQPTTGLEYPDQYFNGGNYWVDVVVSDVDPGADVRDTAGSADITGLLVSSVFSKSVDLGATVPVALDVTGGSVEKSVDIAASTPVTLGVTAGDLFKLVDDTVSVPVTVGLTGVAEATGAGVNAPVSDVLCSSWANWLDVPQRLKDKLPDLGEADWQELLLRASELLWMLSGRRWYGGGCTETAVLRSWPPQQGRGDWPYSRSWRSCGCWAYATWMDGQPYPGDYAGSHVSQPYAIKLPRSPITNILTVTIDGVAFTDYGMYRNGWLERTDGQSWNVCGGDTSVTYQYGEPPPRGGKQATIDLAYEMGREQVGDGDCRLPNNVVSITRQGVTIQRLAATDFQALYRTGLPEVDRWLVAVNPESRPTHARVWSPDLPSAVRTPQ